MDDELETSSYDYEDFSEGSQEPGEDSNGHVNMDRLPLVPTDFSSVEEALQNFAAVFESRYGGLHPRFQISSLRDALDEAFRATTKSQILEQRPLAIYLHRDDAIGCNIFAQNVLCSEAVASLLNGQFVLWPWDMSQADNRAKFIEWLGENNLTQVKDVAKYSAKDEFPLLFLLTKDRATINVEEIIRGTELAEGVMGKMINCLDTFQSIKNRIAAEEQNRLERAAIRQEQVDEYEKSKAIDRARQEEMQRQRQQEMDEQAQVVQKQADLDIRREGVRDSLPDEPDPSSSDLIRVAIGFPNGARVERRFRKDDSLQLLFKVAFANENCPVDFSLVSSYPRRTLKCAPEWYRRFSSADVFADDKVPTFREAGFETSSAVLVSNNEA